VDYKSNNALLYQVRKSTQTQTELELNQTSNQKQLCQNKCHCTCKAGAAGVGKSKLLKAIVLFLRLQFGSKAAEVVAQTNAAAKLVDGHTIDSTFPAVITKHVSDEKALKRKQTAINSFHERFSHVKLLIHEEHSLTNSETIYHIHCCFCAAFPEKAHLPFAGFHVIFAYLCPNYLFIISFHAGS